MNKNYLQLEFGTGYFFKYSKEQKEGYDKHESSKGNVSYRKYFKEGVSGILESASIHEGNFGNDISLTLKDGNEIYYVPVSVVDQKGNVDTYAESLIKLLPELEKGMNLTIRGYNFTPEGEKYSKIGISISVDGEKVKPSMTNSYFKEGNLVEGDIPAIAWKKNPLGKNKPTAVSLEAKNEYLLEVLKVQTDRLKWESSSSDKKEDTEQETKPQEKSKEGSKKETKVNKPTAEGELPF